MLDWKAGDLAICVNSEWGTAPPEPYPKRGEIGEVLDVGACACGCGLVYLCFERWHGTAIGWNHTGFRKIDPLTPSEESAFKASLGRDKKKERA